MNKRHHTCVQTQRMYNSKGELYSQLGAEVTTKQRRDLNPGRHATRSRDRGDGNGCPCVCARKTWKLSLPLKFSVNLKYFPKTTLREQKEKDTEKYINTAKDSPGS